MKYLIFNILIFVICSASFAKGALPIIESINSLIIVQLQIEGNNYKFLLDTGSNKNFLDPSFVRKLKKNIVRKKKLDKKVTQFNKKVDTKGYEFSFDIDDFKYHDMESYELDTKRFNKLKDGIDCCDGILGVDFFKKYYTKVDDVTNVVTISKALPKEVKNWYQIPFEIVGNNIIEVDCKSSLGGDLNLRVDSGAEFPLILQTAFSKKKFIREKILKSSNLSKVYTVGLGTLSCGDLNVLANGFVYTKNSGALAHSFVDGNLGAIILGRQYLFDFEKKIIYINPKFKYKDIRLTMGVKQFDIDLFNNVGYGTNEGSVLQAEVLIYKSCLDQSSAKECMQTYCSIKKPKTCNFSDEKDKLKQSILSITNGNFYGGCSLELLKYELQSRPLKYSFCWWMLQQHYTSQLKQQKIKSFKFETKLPIDKKLNLKVVKDQLELTSDLYCYYIFNNLITYKTLPANMFALSIKGASLSQKSIYEYLNWLKTNKGESCTKYLSEDLGIVPSNLIKDLLKNKKYLVYINPLTILGDGANNKFSKSINVTYNHERLHLIFAESKAIRDAVKKKWNLLGDKKKNIFLNKHKGYNFSDPKIIYREYFSYGYEANPLKYRELLN